MPASAESKPAWFLGVNTNGDLKATPTDFVRRTRPRPGEGKDKEDGDGQEVGSVSTASGLPPMQTLVRQVMANTQANRAFAALLFQTLLLLATCGAVKVMQAAQSSYSAAVRAQEKGHKLGPPYAHVLQALVEWLSTSDKLGDPARQYFTTELAKINGCADIMSVAAMVGHLKLTKAYKNTHVKFQISLVDKTLERAIVESLVTCGAELKIGQAPAGGNERILQEWLDSQ